MSSGVFLVGRKEMIEIFSSSLRNRPERTQQELLGTIIEAVEPPDSHPETQKLKKAPIADGSAGRSHVRVVVRQA